MAKNLQKLIYNLSAALPLCFVFAVLWCIQNHTWQVPVISGCIGGILTLFFAWSFCFGKKNAAPIAIQVTDLSPHDGWIVAYIFSYLIPFASMTISDFDLIICGILAAALIIIASFVNSAIPNPLLVLRGYHFYQISSETGVSGYVLISKRKLRKATDIRTVKRIFEFLLVDSEG